VAHVSDPFDVLRYADSISVEARERTDARLRAAELVAIETAAPTRHTANVITSWRDARRRVAVVSNNSQRVVEHCLAAHGIATDAVVGRTLVDPALLKPDVHLIRGERLMEPGALAVIEDMSALALPRDVLR
jgi:beta-phosphoglucomutase-like phosphatase (HAD superfamily)